MGQNNTHQDSPQDVRMVLLGATGSGKSSVGNNLLGKNLFEAKNSDESVTEKCQVQKRLYKDKQLVVVDTPGFFDTGKELKTVDDEIAKSYTILAPGPHAFLIVHDISTRLTKQQAEAAKRVTRIFGKEAKQFCVVVFTGEDKLDGGTPVKSFIDSLKPNSLLKGLIDEYGGRYVVANNKRSDAEKKRFIDDLLNIVKNMVTQTADGHYSTDKFSEVAKIVKQSQARGFEIVDSDGLVILIPDVKRVVGSYHRRNSTSDADNT